MTRFALFGPVLLACLAALAGLWGALDAYAQGLAVGAIYGGLALAGPALLIGRSVQQDAGDELDDWHDLDELAALPATADVWLDDNDRYDIEEWEPPAPLPPPPAVRVVSVERPQPKLLTGGNR